MGAYIFLCNDKTKAEVFQRKLMGTRAGVSHLVRVRKGDLLFLYDYSTQARQLHGPFIATTDAGMKLVPEAWKGRFPWQMRFEERFAYRALSYHEFKALLNWGDQGYPHPRLTWPQMNALRRLMVSGEIPVRELPESHRGYLFLCNNTTAVECFDNMVFGASGEVRDLYRSMRPGDWLFLFNFQTGELYGPFRALTQLEYRESSGLFGEHFPHQVDVDYVGSDRSIPLSDLHGLVEFRGRSPLRVLSTSQVRGLLSRLAPSRALPSRTPALPPGVYHARDGHPVRSRAELSIDDALDELKVRHHYEKSLFDPGTGEEYLADWYLPDADTYIEYWELQDPDYLQRKDAKKQFYQRSGLRLIELGPEDLANLTQALRRKLRLPVSGHS